MEYPGRKSSRPQRQRRLRNLTRISYDPAVKRIDEYEAQRPGWYQVNAPGFRPFESTGQYAAAMGAEPMMFQRQYFNGPRVDTDSKMRFAALTNPRLIHQLFARPFGGSFRGPGQPSLGNKDLESELLAGHQMRTHKSVQPTAEATIDRFIPLPEYGNPQRVWHVVEPWTRGGEHTRDYVRRVDWERRCGHALNSQLIDRKTKQQAMMSQSLLKPSLLARADLRHPSQGRAPVPAPGRAGPPPLVPPGSPIAPLPMSPLA